MPPPKLPHSYNELEKIWNQVPPNYYQEGVEKNVLQKLWHTKKLNTILDLIEETGISPKKILDVGCASGWFLSQLSRKYPKTDCVGVDVYKKAIDYGKVRYKSLKFVVADAQKLPFPSRSFDTIVCTEVLEHIVSPKTALLEIKRVLKPHGTAIIEMDSGNLLFRLNWYWWTNLRHGAWRDSHIHKLNVKKLERIIKQSGFSILKKKTFNFTMAVAFLVKH